MTLRAPSGLFVTEAGGSVELLGGPHDPDFNSRAQHSAPPEAAPAPDVPGVLTGLTRERFAEVVVGAIAHYTGPLKARVAALEKRLAELEKAPTKAAGAAPATLIIKHEHQAVPLEVSVALPPRKSTSEIERDAAGQMTRVTQIEKDA